MKKHQDLVHSGEQADFIMRVIGSHESALSRQVSEAVRIRRRGGEGQILNSKSEYTRCHIPRLQVEDKEEATRREQQQQEEWEQRDMELDADQREWMQRKTRERDKERQDYTGSLGSVRNRGKGAKRQELDGSKGRRSKRRKYSLLREDWGAPDTAEEQGAIQSKGGEEAVMEEGS